MSVLVAMTFNVLDLVTGFVTALKLKDLQSSKLRDGLFKKAGFLMCYIVAWILDDYGELIGFQIAIPILPAVVLYAVTTELVSILENICRLNPDILPQKLMDIFHISGKEGRDD